MPEPQTGTSTVVATDVETGIRLGIGSHSLGTATARVKSRVGVPPQGRSVERRCGHHMATSWIDIQPIPATWGRQSLANGRLLDEPEHRV